ncbi:Hypothetical predicted protein [Lecanosticta acicola]|uniref:Uncharacterized protein n=1 Tax=Lecanosticta acicola TaxID=111012 RepID=A0AAI8Z091_9PEZI|nr:Hypothetical predicted protein [Lecanosticta acicola]
MSSDRNSRPLKPSLASTRTAARTPLTPRVAAPNASAPSASTPVARPAAPRLPANRTPAVSPRVRAQDETLGRDLATASTVTPRSATRKTRVESAQSSPSQDDPPSDSKSKSSLGPADAMSGRSSAVSGFSLASSNMTAGKPREPRPKSMVGGTASRSPPLVRSPGLVELGQSGQNDSIDSRFFHASDVRRQEPAPKRPEPKKSASFFYADGRQDKPTISPPKAPSPVLSAVSEQRSTGRWIRPESNNNPSRSPSALSPSFAPTAVGSPYFASAVPNHGPYRSPSPSKENMHLSYRKGASQILGMRPTPSPAVSPREEEPRRTSFGLSHKKSPSLSSIDSGDFQQSRRRSATAADAGASTSPLTHEIKALPVPHVSSPPAGLPSIDTSLASPAAMSSPSQPILSPTKNAAELAADARRERKVLDLEISNSSLLAINSSLEREVKRQKSELKRFRRLSRAGRFSMATSELSGRTSDGLSTPSEDDADDDSQYPFDRASGMAEEDLSESEEDASLMSGGEPLSPGAQANREQDRLAKDERRLRVDLDRHKELLTQSQAMNQSIKRCMYATEEMIRDGRRALEYHVRVSDVKLGGRILTGHEDEEIEVEDNGEHEGMQHARELLNTWSGLGRRTEDSEVSGDRDSGIEVDKPLLNVSARPPHTNPLGDSGRPPELLSRGF